MIEARQLIALQALLALRQHMRYRPTLKRLPQDGGNALANLWQGQCRRPFFSPDAFPAPETTSPVMRAFDDAASLSNGGPHSRLTRLHSCSVGDILQYDVRLWPLGPMSTAASQVRRWTNNNRSSPPAADLGRESAPPPKFLHRLADADGC